MKIILDEKDNYIDVSTDLDKQLTKLSFKIPKDEKGYFLVSLNIEEEQLEKLVNALMKSKADIWQRKAK